MQLQDDEFDAEEYAQMINQIYGNLSSLKSWRFMKHLGLKIRRMGWYMPEGCLCIKGEIPPKTFVELREGAASITGQAFMKYKREL